MSPAEGRLAVQVRPATVDDLAAILALLPAAADGAHEGQSLAAALHSPVALLRVAARGAPIVSVDRAEATVVAAAHLQRAGPSCELIDVWVGAAWQRRGVAAALLTELFAEVADAGAVEVFCEVARHNAAARALYGRLGFVACGLRRQYYAAHARGLHGYDVGAAFTDALVLRLSLPHLTRTASAFL